VMAGLHAMVRSRLPQYPDALNQLMHELNHYLLATTPDDMFVTLFSGVLDERSGRLIFANAGHPYPILLTAEAEEPVRLSKAVRCWARYPMWTMSKGRLTCNRAVYWRFSATVLPTRRMHRGRDFRRNGSSALSVAPVRRRQRQSSPGSSRR
jgi:hypothetical protein